MTAGPEDPVSLLPTKGRSKKCQITNLPMEILLQIAEYLVPTDASFHVFPSTWQPYGGIRSTIVHKFSEEARDEEDQVKPGTHSQPRQHLTAFAQTCHVLSEAYYETMYSRNHFIFELSSHEVHPVIDGPAAPSVESWTKVIRGKRHNLWPLTERSIQYVRHLTILGTLHWEKTTKTEWYLRNHLLSAIELLQHAQHLKSLTVDLRYARRPACHKNPVQAPPPPPEFDPHRRLAWGVPGWQDTVLRLRSAITEEGYPGLVAFWNLFKDLRGFRDVVLSGHITAEMVEDLRTRMMSEAEPSQSTEDVLEPPILRQPASRRTRGREQAAESQKSYLKRKRDTESSKPLKSVRRA